MGWFRGTSGVVFLLPGKRAAVAVRGVRFPCPLFGAFQALRDTAGCAGYPLYFSVFWKKSENVFNFQTKPKLFRSAFIPTERQI